MTSARHDASSLSLFCSESEDAYLDIVGARVRDDTKTLAAGIVLRTRPPGRGSYPRTPPGYLARAEVVIRSGTDFAGHRFREVGYEDHDAATLSNYRGGTGGEGAYGGSRRPDHFQAEAVAMQVGRPVP
jgi:hypothetical protein